MAPSRPASARSYLCIDLKSFYASVECVERGLDPLTALLAVADPDRGTGTICLALSPALKALGIRNRCRVYEIPRWIPYVKAVPRMKLYIDYAARIYSTYLDFIAAEDIHVYSIDEAFFDVTAYLRLYHASPRELAVRLMDAVLRRTGIRATAGIGTNLYLAKIALDILAKHAPDFIGELDEPAYRERLWRHQPLTDFWRIGPGIARHLATLGLFTMEDIAHAPTDLLYREFGVDAELLIDHAWGREPVRMADIKAYRSKTHSLSSGQVFLRDYAFAEARLVAKEMMDQLCLDMVEKGVATASVTLWVAYSSHPAATPAPAPGEGIPGVSPEDVRLPGVAATATLVRPSSSGPAWIAAIDDLFARTVSPAACIRRVNLSCNHLVREEDIDYGLFDDPAQEVKTRSLQSAVNTIKRRFGKDAILKGMDFLPGATTRERNHQIGGHKSGE
ncbi:MAG: DNA repair protein [Kiritimatiellae bacterium]|nr:DNA repair protein [Kiritimatiellia bacterium]